VSSLSWELLLSFAGTVLTDQPASFEAAASPSHQWTDWKHVVLACF
jgi:hypothetical protein